MIPVASENIPLTVTSSKMQTDSWIRHFVFAPPQVLLLAFALCGIGVWSLQTNILGLFHDDGVYAVVAKSLSEGQGRRISSLLTSPAQTKSPVLYLYLLSWVWSFNCSFSEKHQLAQSGERGLSVFYLVAESSRRRACLRARTRFIRSIESHPAGRSSDD
jgi:hypothetical protein